MKRNFLVLLLIFVLAFALQACGSDDSTEGNNNPDGDTDTGSDNDATADYPTQGCDSCLANQYCDANDTCQNISCTCCSEDYPCDEGMYCTNGMCVGLCQGESDCPGGFACSGGECTLAAGKKCPDGYDDACTDFPADGDGEEEPPPECDPACNAFQYCDTTDAENPSCEDIECTCCHEDDPCDGNNTCSWINGEYGFCAPTCTESTDCSGGFECIAGMCKLASGKQCPTDTGDNCDPHQANAPGGVCAFGTVWPGRSCEAGVGCLGIAADSTDATSQCNTNDDCAEKGFGPNGFCDWSVSAESGYCAFSVCASDCDANNNCPDGMCSMMINSGTVCVCLPADSPYVQCTGDQMPGDVCEFPSDDGNTTYNEGLWCAEGGDCFSVPENSQLACTDADPTADQGCIDLLNSPHAFCDAGYCRTSYCAGRAEKDAQDVCDCSSYVGSNNEETFDIGYEYVQLPDNCWCAPWPEGNAIGDQEVGEPCKYTFDAAYDGLFCVEDAYCINLSLGEMTPCAGDDTVCKETTNMPTASCFEGSCRSSYCASECVSDACAEAGEWPVEISGYCFCVPYPMGGPTDGTKQLGETCQLGAYNVPGLWDGEYCVDGLECVGKGETETACTADAECVTAHGANSKCNTTAGKCAYSVCADRCGGGSLLTFCGADQGHLKDTEACYCIPGDSSLALPAGTGVLGAACAYNNDAVAACGAGMECIAVNMNDQTTGEWVSCTEATPCQGDWPISGGANGACTAYGICNTSFCAARCNDQNACDAGEKIDWFADDLGCWCTTTPYNTTETAAE